MLESEAPAQTAQAEAFETQQELEQEEHEDKQGGCDLGQEDTVISVMRPPAKRQRRENEIHACKSEIGNCQPNKSKEWSAPERDRNGIPICIFEAMNR